MFGTKESFIYLRNLALKLNISCAEKSTNRFGSFAYTVFTKSLICSDTLFNLIYPVPRLIEGISKSPMVIYDLSSTFVLIRSLFESYVNTCYILLNNESDEQKELKFLLWQRHSRKERQRMAEFSNLRHSIIDKEKNEIELLNQAILQNKYYLIQKTFLRVIIQINIFAYSSYNFTCLLIIFFYRCH